jgi:glycerophosphoryl diester phosphodiesterase
MRFIAHRGNINGINVESENTIEYIISAINQGFDVEIDVRYKSNVFYLGHDESKNVINLSFLRQHSNFLWCHAKDIYTLNELLKYRDINCFFHQNDDCTLTSCQQIWTHVNFDKSLTERTILLKFAKDENFTVPENIFGICSDNVKYYKNKRNG